MKWLVFLSRFQHHLHINMVNIIQGACIKKWPATAQTAKMKDSQKNFIKALTKNLNALRFTSTRASAQTSFASFRLWLINHSPLHHYKSNYSQENSSNIANDGGCIGLKEWTNPVSKCQELKKPVAYQGMSWL